MFDSTTLEFTDLDNTADMNNAEIERWKTFNRALNARLPDGTKQADRTLFNTLMVEILPEEPGKRKLSNRELMLVLNRLQDLKDPQGFEYTRDFIEIAPEDFRNLDIVKERYLVALNKTDQPDQAIKVAREIHRNGKGNGETWAQLGKAYRVKYEAAQNYLKALASYKPESEIIDAAKAAYESVFIETERVQSTSLEAQVKDLQSRCRQAYTVGFEHSYDHYPGINAAFEAMKAGDYQDAKILAQLTYEACRADGGLKAQDFYCGVTMVQAACLIGANEEEIFHTLAKVQKTTDWNLEGTIGELQKALPHIEHMGGNPQATQEVLNILQRQLNGENVEIPFTEAPRTKTDAINSRTMSFRKPSFFVGGHILAGNYNFGGNLNDHTVTRKDLELLTPLLDIPLGEIMDPAKLSETEYQTKLSDIKDPEKFSAIVNKFVRYHFGNEYQNLEKIDGSSPRNSLGEVTELSHETFDDTVKAQAELSGMTNPRGADSRSNITAALALGLGDCRPHAYTKQALFDVWQRQQMTKALRSAHTAARNGDMIEYQEKLSKFEDIERTEMVIFDAVLKAPIAMHNKYKPQRDENDGFIPSQGINDVEDHTMNLMLRRNEYGDITSVKFADAFYHQPYNFADGEIPIDEIEISESVKVDEKTGEEIYTTTLKFPGKTLSLADGTTVPVTLTNTAYGGDRTQIARDEHGATMLMGQNISDQLDSPQTLINMLKDRATTRQRLEATRVWAEELKREHSQTLAL